VKVDKMARKVEVESEYGFDLENRDPLDKNPHVRTLYEDALGEPEGTRSIDGVWSCSYKTYNCSKSCCYIVLSVLCGGPAALMWGLTFACISCMHIWCLTPCVKAFDICAACYGSCWKKCLVCYCNPIYEAVGRMFSNIRFNHRYEQV